MQAHEYSVDQRDVAVVLVTTELNQSAAVTACGGWINIIYVDGLDARSCGYFQSRREALVDGHRAAAHWLEHGNFEYQDEVGK